MKDSGILSHVHTLYQSLAYSDKRKLGPYLTNMMAFIHLAHSQKITYFCGRKPVAIVSGLLHLRNIEYDLPLRQKDIIRELNTSHTTIHANAVCWMQNFPNLFPQLRLFYSKGKLSVMKIPIKTFIAPSFVSPFAQTPLIALPKSSNHVSGMEIFAKTANGYHVGIYKWRKNTNWRILYGSISGEELEKAKQGDKFAFHIKQKYTL